MPSELFQMSIERFLVFGSVIAWALLSYCTAFWVESVDGYLVGNRRRVIAMWRIQCILTLLNVFAYGQLMRWFDDDVTREKVQDRRQMQNFSKWAKQEKDE
ncbi:unnamed protein product [Caenorhabditis nigoni]